MTLNVVCIKWGTKYSPDYVNHLGRGSRRFLRIPHRFVCLTDDRTGIDDDFETLPFVDDLPGWWNKIALFKSSVHDLRGTILYIDLDMVIIRNIDALATCQGDFVAMETFWRPGEFASALMRFEIGRFQRVWDMFVPRAVDVMREIYGDQNWINACCATNSDRVYTHKVGELWPEVTPDHCMIEPLPRSWFPDYKGELTEGPDRLSSAAKVIVFHGRPMVHEVDWVARLWRGESCVSDLGHAP
jgi:hypothetical protein